MGKRRQTRRWHDFQFAIENLVHASRRFGYGSFLPDGGRGKCSVFAICRQSKNEKGLKATEDKTFRGGNVASLSKPWITRMAANEANVGGYHLVWSRDLYQVATAYIALGDKDSAVRALDYLFNVQQRKNGNYPQISWLDGRTLGDSIQMDEVAYPLILAYQLGQNSKEIYLKNIKPTELKNAEEKFQNN